MANISYDRWVISAVINSAFTYEINLMVNNTLLPEVEPTDEQMLPVITELKSIMQSILPEYEVKARRVRSVVPEEVEI